MAPGLTSNPAVSAGIYTTAASAIVKFGFADQLSSYPLYKIFLGILPFVGLLQVVYHVVLYPRFFTPLRNFPIPSDVSSLQSCSNASY